MQYAAANILLHRPLAQFGNAASLTTGNVSRQICVQHACLIAHYLQDYHDRYGSAMTLSWVSLHIVATGATTLIASTAENQSNSLEDLHFSCLQTCISALSELEKSHLPTKRARKVIQHAIRVLDLDDRVYAAPPLREVRDRPLPSISIPPPGVTLGDGVGSGGLDFFADISETFSFEEFLPPGSQTDMLHSVGSFLV